MDAMMWIVLVSALILAAGGVAYFEVALRRNVFSQRSQPFPANRMSAVKTRQPVSRNRLSRAAIPVKVKVERSF